MPAVSIGMDAQGAMVTISFFRFSGFADRWWALGRMGLAPGLLTGVSGLSFGKMLGSGGGSGFSIRPNFGVYGLLGVWESEAKAQAFFRDHSFFLELKERSREFFTLFLHTTRVQGQWDGVSPFSVTVPGSDSDPVCVLTRATIRTRHLWRFWRYVAPVSRSIEQQEGCIFSIGIGELPIVQQATFSLWRNSRQMQAFAYQRPHHAGVVRRTREVGWYREELFARFVPYACEGTWGGQGLLPDMGQVSGNKKNESINE